MIEVRESEREREREKTLIANTQKFEICNIFICRKLLKTRERELRAYRENDARFQFDEERKRKRERLSKFHH